MPYKTIEASSTDQLDEYLNLLEKEHKYIEVINFRIEDSGFYAMVFYSDNVIIEFIDDEENDED